MTPIMAVPIYRILRWFRRYSLAGRWPGHGVIPGAKQPDSQKEEQRYGAGRRPACPAREVGNNFSQSDLGCVTNDPDEEQQAGQAYYNQQDRTQVEETS